MDENNYLQTEYEQPQPDAYGQEPDFYVRQPEAFVQEPEAEAVKPKKKKRRRRRRSGLLRFLLTVLLCWLAYLFATSDFFAVRELDVSGNRFYTKAQVAKLSQLQTGYNLFTVDLSSARELLLADPYIRTVHLKRELPDTLIIQIEERLEFAAIPYGEQYILIDDAGTVLRLTDNQPVLPQLDGMIIEDMTPGEPLTVQQSYLLTDTLQMISCMEENDLFFKRIVFSTVIVRAYIYDDYYIEGTPENITTNMKRVHQLIEEHYRQGITRGVIKVSKGEYIAFDPQID